VVNLVEKTFDPVLPELLCITLNIPLADTQSSAYLKSMAQLALNKVGEYVTISVSTIDMVAKNRRSIMKIIDKSFLLEKTNTAVYQLRAFREYGQLHLHRTFFLPNLRQFDLRQAICDLIYFHVVIKMESGTLKL
jgi:hypothetical protein